LFCLIIGLLAILDFYINFLPLEYLRPNAISYLHEYSRGSVGSSLMLIAYKGFFAHTHFFAIERFIWMSLSLTLFIYYKREGKASTFSNVLLLSALLGLIEIFLSQTRFLSLFSLLIFFIAFLKQPNRTWSYLAIFFSFPLLIYLFTTETFNYYYLAISTIFDSGIQNDTGKVISYVLVNDKRYQALAAIFNNLADYRIYFSYGPLFFNYSTELHGVNTEVFDDLTLIILSLLEYGILAYFLCILFVIRILMLKGLKFKKYINFILIVTILSSASTYYPRLMFYVFFFLGAGYSLSLAVNQIKKNHKPQKF
jgi:hypothetical protein